MKTNQEMMDNFHECLLEGNIQKAYRIVFDILSKVKTKLSSNNKINIPNNIYHGYLDMTYFPVFSDVLKQHSLKIAIVFNYEKFSFEIWLSANNKKIQKKYWEIIKEKKWKKYRLMESIVNEDSIIEYPIKTTVNYNEINKLVNIIEKQSIDFIVSIEEFLNTL